MERAILTLPQDVTRGRDSLTAKQKHTTNTHSTLDRPRISQCLTTFHERTKEEGGKSREPIEPWTPLFRKLTHTHTQTIQKIDRWMCNSSAMLSQIPSVFFTPNEAIECSRTASFVSHKTLLHQPHKHLLNAIRFPLNHRRISKHSFIFASVQLLLLVKFFFLFTISYLKLLFDFCMFVCLPQYINTYLFLISNARDISSVCYLWQDRPVNSHI